MRKYILSISFCFITVISFCASVQLTVTGNHWKDTRIISKDTVTVILFDSITNSSTISYTGGGTNVNWYKYADTNNCISCNMNYLSPEDSTGYVLDVDGKRSAIWVLSYKNHKPKFISLEPDKSSANQCSELKLTLSGNVPTLGYQTLKGHKNVLPRTFSVKYQTMSWNSDKWNTIDTTETVTMGDIVVKAPLCNTFFTLSGDQYISDLRLSPYTVKSSNYNAVAVKCNLSSITTLRTEINEGSRPTTASQLEGSAPLDMQFLSNANEPSTRYYLWEILKNGKSLVAPRIDKDQRYSFTEAGDYLVRLKASNDNCSSIDSVAIKVLESAIQVPNVFTPNGDGINDEFRVAYKSIVRFHCWIYNRWGRNVFEWTDPQKGWDGTIGTSKASPGPYYYVIEAYGSDVDAEGVPKKYLLKGDINLLRGKE